MKNIKKAFQYKGQMVNYYNKVVANDNVEFATCYGAEADENGNCYFVEYRFKKAVVRK